MKPLAVLGTSSDAGKTTLAMALCRLFADRGYKVAPFKGQNVSNNSAVTKEQREISRAQCLQAEAARVEPSYLFNPVLLKSHGNGSVQVVVNGLVYKHQTIAEYYAEMDFLKAQVSQAFFRLQQNYDVVIAEGAGSPVELNLLHKDLSNTFVAKTFETKNILVADIERGGVFASIFGTLELLDPVLRNNLLGVVINKFRGDRRFFVEGEKIIRERFGVPVLGVLPFQPLNIDMEDSQSLQNYHQRLENPKIRIAVIAYNGLSNYNDLDVLMADPELQIELIQYFKPLEHFDLVILPGSKTVIRDLQWLKTNGLFAELNRFGQSIFGICGGYQMMCISLHDPEGVEHDKGVIESGLNVIADRVVYQQAKVLYQGEYSLFNCNGVAGYEIHCGRMQHFPLYYQKGRVAGTHVHGVFDNNQLRNTYFRSINASYQGFDYPAYREQQITEFTEIVQDNLAIDSIIQALQTT